MTDIENIKDKYIEDLFERTSKKSKTHIEFKKNALEPQPDDIKYIAFYLPQFHPIPENDEWWGKGFTEWTNVSKAVPRFVGHYQPHLPGELGFYDLRIVDVMKRQIELAKNYGIFGFCFYFYWFGGKTLLELPLRNLLQNQDLDIPFCLCWANENWTRGWDGLEHEILINQKHSAEDDLAFIRYLQPYLKDNRYIRIDNRPVLIVYRPRLLPTPRQTLEIWRKHCRESGIGEIYIIGAQSFGFYDYREVGFDASVEFPPHFFLNYCDEITQKVQMVDPEFQGKVMDYESLVRYRKFAQYERFSPFKTVFPCWDNTARRPDSSVVFHGSTPELYKEWLTYVSVFTRMKKSRQEQYVFINAWNEWAEGAHLEPDREYGYGYLQATYEALLDYRIACSRLK